ncbi:rho-related GTP-binding protein RhoF isoform 1-T1 [Molossus nigricans]
MVPARRALTVHRETGSEQVHTRYRLWTDGQGGLRAGEPRRAVGTSCPVSSYSASEPHFPRGTRTHVLQRTCEPHPAPWRPALHCPGAEKRSLCVCRTGLGIERTGGQEDYDRLRPLSYQNTHLVLICYDVMNPTSYDNVLIKWFPEVTHFCRGTPMVLIGCKTDLRKDKEQLRKLRAAQLEPITYMQGMSACQQIQAALYLECSAKFRENVEDVFREAAKVALSALKKAQRQKHRRLCLLL